MIYRTLRRITLVILLFLSPLLLTDSLFSRDINLDEIYINPQSTLYTRLIQKKTSLYNTVESEKIDTNVIFSGWVSPSSVVYIKEFKDANRNIVYQYNLSDKKTKLIEISGGLIYTRLSQNGKFLVCKSLTYNGNESFTNKILILDLSKNELHTRDSHTVFTDFTLSPLGDTLYYESSSGISAYNPGSKKETLFLPKDAYRNYVSSEHTTLCYRSPRGNRFVLLNGGGGSYKGILFQNGSYAGTMSGITSSREFFWINNSTIVFRSGYIGNYSIRTYNTGSRSYKTILRKSLNTNITDSSSVKYITFVQDGILHTYNTDDQNINSFMIEGEDAVFSPLGDYFSSLFNKTLYITRFSSIRDRKMELRRESSSILDLYKSIESNSSIQENDYSTEYIKRKISVYKNVSH